MFHSSIINLPTSRALLGCCSALKQLGTAPNDISSRKGPPTAPFSANTEMHFCDDAAHRRPSAESCSLQPCDARFLQLDNHRVVLEEALSQFNTLTEGTKIALEQNGQYYAMLVTALGPEPSGCSILNTDLAVDLVPMMGEDGKPIHIPEASKAAADARGGAATDNMAAAIARAEERQHQQSGSIDSGSSDAGIMEAGGAAAAAATTGGGSYTLEVPVNFAEGLQTTLASGAYSTFTFGVPEGAGFTVTVELDRSTRGGGSSSSAALDFEAYLGRRNCPKPTRENHHASCSEGENVGKAVIVIDPAPNTAAASSDAGAGAPRGTPYYLGVAPYQCTGCNIRIQVMLANEGGEGEKDDAVAAPLQVPTPPPNGDRCGHCGVIVPAGRLAMHMAFCERNNTKCLICDQVVRKSGGHHWHCELCLDPPFVCNSAEARAKHNAIYHSKMTCECGETADLRKLMLHKETECKLRQVICRFCDAAHAAGDPPADAVDRHLGFTNHEAVCGAKTSICKICNKNVRRRDMKAHMLLHGYTDSLRGSSSSSSAATTAVAPPAPKTDLEKAIQQSLQDQSSANGVNSAADPEPVEPPKKEEPVELCTNPLCVQPQASNSLHFCKGCWAKVGAPADDPAAVMKAVIQKIFVQMTKGCGGDGCENVHCATAVGGASKPPNVALPAALAMARGAQTAGISLCVSASEQARKKKVEALGGMGFPMAW